MRLCRAFLHCRNMRLLFLKKKIEEKCFFGCFGVYVRAIRSPDITVVKVYKTSVCTRCTYGHYGRFSICSVVIVRWRKSASYDRDVTWFDSAPSNIFPFFNGDDLTKCSFLPPLRNAIDYFDVLVSGKAQINKPFPI